MDDADRARGARSVAFVTGGRQGIGRGVSVALGRAGFDVVVADLHEDDEAARALEVVRATGAAAAFVRLDVRDLAAHGPALDAAEAALGPVRCLVNNAGIAPRRRGDLLEVSPESFDEVLATNLRGPFFLSQRAAARMLASSADGQPRTIVNVSSVSAALVSIERGEYCVSKAGMAMMSKLFAMRLAPSGIGVYEVRPGIVRTPMTSAPEVQARHDAFIAGGGVPAGRWGDPEDVGRSVAALATGALAFSPGEVIHVDGGLSVQRL